MTVLGAPAVQWIQLLGAIAAAVVAVAALVRSSSIKEDVIKAKDAALGTKDEVIKSKDAEIAAMKVLKDTAVASQDQEIARLKADIEHYKRHSYADYPAIETGKDKYIENMAKELKETRAERTALRAMLKLPPFEPGVVVADAEGEGEGWAIQGVEEADGPAPPTSPAG